jgi:hypothetical protein
VEGADNIMGDEYWEEFEDDEHLEEATKRIIMRLRKHEQISDAEEVFWLGFKA